MQRRSRQLHAESPYDSASWQQTAKTAHTHTLTLTRSLEVDHHTRSNHEAADHTHYLSKAKQATRCVEKVKNKKLKSKREAIKKLKQKKMYKSKVTIELVEALTIELDEGLTIEFQNGKIVNKHAET